MTKKKNTRIAVFKMKWQDAISFLLDVMEDKTGRISRYRVLQCMYDDHGYALLRVTHPALPEVAEGYVVPTFDMKWPDTDWKEVVSLIFDRPATM